ncbi:MAG: type II secretion system F family protein [Nanoarchaeota archaeon]
MRSEQFSFESIGKAFIPKRFRHKLGAYLMKVGMDDVPFRMFGMIFYGIFFLSLLVYFNPFFSIFSFISQYALFGVFVYTFAYWVGAMLVFSIAFMIIFKTAMDIKIYQRRLAIEEVLPDFLQLTAANIRAGMPIDRALWYAVRPRFGVLANEIELVAKETLSGKDLQESLMQFSKKYDSPTVERSFNLLLSGIEAGGEIGDLLNKIAMNIQELRTMKKEMAANVTTYVIFISFATVAAAPFLFALSFNLLIVIQRIMSNISLPDENVGGGGMGNMLSNLNTDTMIAPSEFQVFVVIMLLVTSFFSAVIVATIRHGSVKEGFKMIPPMMAGTVIIYFIASKILGIFLASIV